MKRLKTVLSLLASLAAVLCVALHISPVQAEEYTFTVRVYAGNQGTIEGSDVYVTKDIKYGETFSFNVNDVKVTDDKYYAKGLRYAGNDNDDMLGASVEFDVTSDVDLVVTYGVKGEQVPYTVRYVSYPDGAMLAKTETFYGNIGDKPVVAYHHIEGYVPRYKNITGTLKESGNEFVFEYTKVEAGAGGEETTVTTTTVVVPGTAGTAPAANGNNARGNQLPNTAGNNPAGNPDGNNTQAAPAGTENTNDQQTAVEPAQNQNTSEAVHDIDSPTAGNNGSESAGNAGTTTSNHLPVIIGGTAGGAVLIGILGALYARFRNRS